MSSRVNPTAIPPFVDVAWAQAHRGDLVLADVRFYLDGRSGRAAYEAGHIPGAVFVDLDTVLSARPGLAGRHPLPDPTEFAAGLSALGIGDGDAVIGYDDAGGLIAARLVWMLRATGHAAAVLDGGLAAWPGPLETDVPARPPASFTPRPWPRDLLATIDEVAATSEVLVDGRDHARYAGGPDPVDPRSGHIPGARSLPARDNLGSDGRLLAPDELRRRYAEAGIGPGTPVISYCGSGVTACHNLLALERAGLGPGRLYPGSWSEWSRDPQRPLAT
ncbi:MAG TPA: sulfurtransferase [Solirubrobacteraceae bacterium]|nr:sulfurtransferase [Solirubrobacteraceae bacterium]